MGSGRGEQPLKWTPNDGGGERTRSLMLPSTAVSRVHFSSVKDEGGGEGAREGERGRASGGVGDLLVVCFFSSPCSPPVSWRATTYDGCAKPVSACIRPVH